MQCLLTCIREDCCLPRSGLSHVSDTASSHWADAGLDDDAALIAAATLADGDGVGAKFFHELVISCRGLAFEPPNGGLSLPRLGEMPGFITSRCVPIAVGCSPSGMALPQVP